MNARDVKELIKVEGTAKTYGHALGFEWELGKIGSGHIVYIPPITVFTFDVSTPRGFHWLFDPHNIDHLVAAALHDWLLITGYDPAFASAEFRRLLRARRVSAQSSWRAYFATLCHTAFK